MKKLIFVLAAIIVTLNAFSQESKFSFGISGGMNITNVNGINEVSNLIDSKSLIGLRANVLLGYKFSEHFLLLFEPGIEQKGYKTGLIFTDEVGNDIGTGDLLYVTNYVTSPLTLNYTGGSKIKLNIGAGLYIGVLINSKLKIRSDDFDLGIDDLETSSNYKSTDFGALARASVEIKLLSFLAAEITGNYSLGLGKINSDIFYSDAGLKNRSIFLGAGIRLYFAGKAK